MLLEPRIVRTLRPEPDRVELELAVARDLSYFADHFPRHPMLPGVVQLGWAVRCCQREFCIDKPFRRLSGLKFVHPVLPGSHLTLRLDRLGPTLVAFAYSLSGDLCSMGRLSFADAGD